MACCKGLPARRTQEGLWGFWLGPEEARRPSVTLLPTVLPSIQLSSYRISYRSTVVLKLLPKTNTWSPADCNTWPDGHLVPLPSRKHLPKANQHPEPHQLVFHLAGGVKPTCRPNITWNCETPSKFKYSIPYYRFSDYSIVFAGWGSGHIGKSVQKICFPNYFQLVPKDGATQLSPHELKNHVSSTCHGFAAVKLL